MIAVPYDSSAEDTLGGTFPEAAGASGEECEVLVWGLVNRAGGGEVPDDIGVSTREDPKEEGAGDDEIIDPSCEDDCVGTSNGGRDWRVGRGMAMAGDPLCS